MFQRTNVKISKEIYWNNLWIIRILRAFGLFPFVVLRTKSAWILKWSPWVALYSYAFGAAIIILSWYIHVYDILLTHADSVDIITSTDKIVGIIVIFGYCIMTFCGIFIVPSKFPQILEYVKLINKVDTNTHITTSKTERYGSLHLLFLLYGYNGVLVSLGTYLDYSFAGDEISHIKIFRRNLHLAVLCHITLSAEYAGLHMAYGLERRIIQLNKALGLHYKKIASSNIIPIISRKNRGRFSLEPFLNSQATNKLNKVILTLINAGNLLNNAFALNNLIAITSVLFQLVVGPYFLILSLKGQRKGLAELTLRFLILFLQIIRVLIITEPWYACMGKFDTTSKYICKLLSLDVGPYYRKQVKAIATSLTLRQMKFSAWGLFNMDRMLLTSLIGSCATYVSILLQVQQHDIK